MRFALAAITMIAMATPSLAQQATQPQPDYTVRLSAAKWNVILTAIGERPAKEVFDTLLDIQQQISAAQRSKEAPKSPPQE